MSDHIEQVVDRVYQHFAAKRPIIRAAASVMESALDQLGKSRQLVEHRVTQFTGTFNIDRGEVITILKQSFAGMEQQVDEGAVRDAIQQEAQEQLKAELIADGMPPDLAAKVWNIFTISVAV